MPRSPLPLRDGIDPTQLRLPPAGPWATVREYLIDTFTSPGKFGQRPPSTIEGIDARFAASEIMGEHGPLHPNTTFVPNAFVWLYRDVPYEAPVPFSLKVVFQDQDILVVDKPHFLASMPRGANVRETALVRVRHELGLADAAPAHRLDKGTAGLLMFTLRKEIRGAYQDLFMHRKVTKTYECIGPARLELLQPTAVASNMTKERGVLKAFEVPGEPNAHSVIQLEEYRADKRLNDVEFPEGLGRYVLKPLTGKTHQLRLHMLRLGAPIINDPLYPELLERQRDNFTAPLQLLAKTLEFTDPLSGKPRRFVSNLQLETWHDPHAPLVSPTFATSPL